MTATTIERERVHEAPPREQLEEGDHERFAHYVDGAKATDAAVFGIPITALCGKVWVPSRDPKKFPVCPTCKELFDMGPEGRQRFWAERAEQQS